MKTRLLGSLIPAAAIFLLFSCSGEELLPDSHQEPVIFYGKDIVYANLEAPSLSTRTALDSDSSSVVWSRSDELSLISSSGKNNRFVLVEGEGSRSASFSGTAEGSRPFTAVYPYSEEISLTDGTLRFKLPSVQVYAENSFGPAASPMVATTEDISLPLDFRNLCGLLCLRVAAKSTPKISRIIVRDLAGNMLWGDCELAIDGKQGTAEQNLKITGGSGEIELTIPSPVSLQPSTPRRFYIAVPPGTLDRGFSVTMYDNTGEVYTTFQTQNPAAKAERSMISNMNALVISNRVSEPSNPDKRGFYKDLFMNGGISLTSRTSLPAASYLGWSMEYFASQSSPAASDTAIQKAFFQKADDDLNGYLLYPDRSPRFRVLYVNGGNSRTHGKSLESAGRRTIYDFVYNGGGYVGTCAGAFLACKGYDSNANYSYYTKIFPGHMYHTGISKDTTDMTMPADSPLRKYFNFGSTVDRIYHNGGGYMSEEAANLPAGTEILLRYLNCPAGQSGINGRVSGWAYKPNASAGRIVLIGSHPEGVSSGDRLNLFSAMLMYSADGHGDIPIKATLQKGVLYDCSELSSANKPAHARIGDKQYHHFKVEIPQGAREISVELESDAVDDDLFLSLRRDAHAWFTEADYTLTGSGSNKALNIKALEAGMWYISVYAPNTVTAAVSTYGSNGKYYKYTGDLTLLDGIPYSIKVDWK